MCVANVKWGVCVCVCVGGVLLHVCSFFSEVLGGGHMGGGLDWGMGQLATAGEGLGLNGFTGKALVV